MLFRNDIRCRAYFSYDRIAKACISKAKEKKKQIFVPKWVGTGLFGTESPGNTTTHTVDVPSSFPPSQSSLPPPPTPCAAHIEPSGSNAGF
jgi:hypothetical protein